MAYLRYGISKSCFCQLCVVLCYLEFTVKIVVPGRRISLFRRRIGTIGLKQVENQMKPNKRDFCTLLIMVYLCTENERNLFSIENRPVGFYTECLLSVHLNVFFCELDWPNFVYFPSQNTLSRLSCFCIP